MSFRILIIIVVLAAIVVIVVMSRCSRHLSVSIATAALNRDDVQSIEDFYSQASKGLCEGPSKDKLRNVEKKAADFVDADKYFDQLLRDASVITEYKNDTDAMLRRLSTIIRWKVAEADLKAIRRVYTVQATTSLLETISTFGNLAYIKIYTDSEGRILGWWSLRDAKLFTE